MDVEIKILHLEGKIAGIDAKIISADAKLIRLHPEMASMKAEILAEIRQLAARIDGLDGESRTPIDRVDALEARLSPSRDARGSRHRQP